MAMTSTTCILTDCPFSRCSGCHLLARLVLEDQQPRDHGYRLQEGLTAGDSGCSGAAQSCQLITISFMIVVKRYVLSKHLG